MPVQGARGGSPHVLEVKPDEFITRLYDCATGSNGCLSALQLTTSACEDGAARQTLTAGSTQWLVRLVAGSARLTGRRGLCGRTMRSGCCGLVGLSIANGNQGTMFRLLLRVVGHYESWVIFSDARR